MKRFLPALLALLLCAPAARGADLPAKELFGRQTVPSAASPQIFGSYAKGCLAGAVSLPASGDGYQAMRLSRNRSWGHPVLIQVIEQLAHDARLHGWPGLLVGDMAQPRGGPMQGGHASHQIGLDVDLWLTPMPAHRLSVEERETIGAISMLRPGTRTIDPAVFGAPQVALIRQAALLEPVERIFVHPAIKQAMCKAAGTERGWLAKLRPWWGHDAHVHLRLRCPAGQPGCRPQDPPPPGDGCDDADLAWWLSDEPWAKPTKPLPPPEPLLLADLPAACREVLDAR